MDRSGDIPALFQVECGVDKNNNKRHDEQDDEERTNKTKEDDPPDSTRRALITTCSRRVPERALGALRVVCCRAVGDVYEVEARTPREDAV